jgi:hypothetical protein
MSGAKDIKHWKQARRAHGKVEICELPQLDNVADAATLRKNRGDVFIELEDLRREHVAMNKRHALVIFEVARVTRGARVKVMLDDRLRLTRLPGLGTATPGTRRHRRGFWRARSSAKALVPLLFEILRLAVAAYGGEVSCASRNACAERRSD